MSSLENRPRVSRRAIGRPGGASRLAGAVPWSDVLLLFALVMLGLASLWHGFDAHLLVTADALYPVQMVEYGIFDYRPPPPNRVFPDVLAHWLASPFLPDPLEQKLAVGVALFAISALAVGLFLGGPAFALFIAITVAGGFEFLVSASHYSLALCVLLFMIARGGKLERPLLFVLVFSNPMVLLPLAFPLVEPSTARRRVADAAIVLAALALNTLYSEFSETLVHIILAFPPWFAAVWIATRFGLARALMVATTIALPLAAMTGLMPGRYGIAVGGAMLLLLFPIRRPAFDWRHLAVPAAVVGIFAGTADWSRQERMAAGHACVVDELAARGIGTVAAGHWTAKPLAFAARDREVELTITQTDFARNRVHPWMAPYDFYGEPTVWALRSGDVCRHISPEATYCGQAETAPVVSAEPVCGDFTLYRYETVVPVNHVPPPASKWQAIGHNLSSYLHRVTGRLGL